ncbi:MAG: hypothetical protein PHH83_03185 [Patescibacteria group bacterium]|nr:hypothetical protein [Patescibacteria group bacterium]
MRTRQAQGILEVLIAIYIAVVGILSIMNLVVASIKVERLNHNMLIATNLAREGLEVVRNIRDSNWIDGSPWNTELEAPENERSFVINNNFLSENQSGYSLLRVGFNWNDCENGGDSSPCKIWLVSKDIKSQNPKINYSQNVENIIASDCGFVDSGLDCIISNTNFYRMIYIYSICYDPNIPLLQDRELINQSTGDCDTVYAGSEEIGLYVISQVGWGEGDFSKSISVSERIYNWK